LNVRKHHIDTVASSPLRASSTRHRAARRYADDRIDSDELPLTHEFLGLMLGTYRPGVTLAVQALEKEGLIDARRGGITILNRKSLEKRSNGMYIRPEPD
jgi:CRP-like cAMP-binding protein